MLSVTAASGFGSGGTPGVAFPSGIGNLRLRYVSDTGVTESSNLVSQWDDQSGNGDHLVEATNKPLLVADLVNGYPGIRFDGSNDAINVSGITAFTDAHLWIVFNPISWAAEDCIMACYVGGGSHALNQHTSTPLIGHATDAASTNRVSATLGTWWLMNSWVDGTTSSYMGLNDNTEVTGGDPGSAQLNFTSCWLGTNSSENFPWNGEIAEVCVYSGGEVSSGNKVLLKEYFNARYALWS
jgi:hypothetical protein